MYEGYCVKCRKKVNFDGEVKTTKNGRQMAQGACPNCGTKVSRFLPGQ
jgi:DNA-directed RNA polymerase subunit RPC12/RpoP